MLINKNCVCVCVCREWKGRGGEGKGGERVLTIRNANYSIPSLLVPCIIISYIFSNFWSPLRNFISSSSERNFRLFFYLYSQIVWITYIYIYTYIHTYICMHWYIWTDSLVSIFVPRPSHEKFRSNSALFVSLLISSWRQSHLYFPSFFLSPELIMWSDLSMTFFIQPSYKNL